MIGAIVLAAGRSRRMGTQKLLLPLRGQPMIAHVVSRALASRAQDVCVATDDQRVADALTHDPVNVFITDPAHTSGTDRIAEV